MALTQEALSILLSACDSSPRRALPWRPRCNPSQGQERISRVNAEIKGETGEIREATRRRLYCQYRGWGDRYPAQQLRQRQAAVAEEMLTVRPRVEDPPSGWGGETLAVWRTRLEELEGEALALTQTLNERGQHEAQINRSSGPSGWSTSKRGSPAAEAKDPEPEDLDSTDPFVAE